MHKRLCRSCVIVFNVLIMYILCWEELSEQNVVNISSLPPFSLPSLSPLRHCTVVWSVLEVILYSMDSQKDSTKSSPQRLLRYIISRGPVIIIIVEPLILLQSVRVKMVQNVTTIERRYSSWIGGSILASLVSTRSFVVR